MQVHATLLCDSNVWYVQILLWPAGSSFANGMLFHLAWVIYEHIMTFSEEVELFWSRKSWAAVLFLANRYLALFYAATRLVCAHNNVRSSI